LAALDAIFDCFGLETFYKRPGTNPGNTLQQRTEACINDEKHRDYGPEVWMSKTDHAKWDGFQADLNRGLKKGILTIGDSGLVVNRKTVQLSEADKIQFKILALKLKAHQQMTHLGARVYSLIGFRGGNPGLDPNVKDITARIRRYETEIAVMEKQLKFVQKNLGKRP
jgi:hypothetical protein